MTKEELGAQISKELAEAEKAAWFWSTQVPKVPDGPLSKAAELALQGALTSADQLRQALREAEDA